jgi:hypothetical protein
MEAQTSENLLSFLAGVPDPRSRRGRRHPLSALLASVCLALFCGAKGDAAIAPWAADQDLALMHRLGFTRRPPKIGGFRKVLMALDVAAFEAALNRWAEAVLGRPVAAAGSPPEAFALDGKSARGSFDGLEKAVHLLWLVAHDAGLTLAQAAVPHGGRDKTNEHKAALRLLEGLVLEGRLVTGDAIFCQRDFCQRVIDAGGDYLVFVKENQPTLLQDIEAAFAPEMTGAFSPSAAADLGGRPGHGDDDRQGARPARAPDAEGDHGAERIPGLARLGPGRADRERGDAGREDLPGGPLLHHQRLEIPRGCRPVAELGAWALVDREPIALRAGRDAGRGRQPDSQGLRPAGDGGAPQCGDRVPPNDGGDERRGGAPS